MPFTEELPRWENPGSEPPEEKKTVGWTVSEKPPADWFNYQWTRSYWVMKELQDKGALSADVNARFDSELHATTGHNHTGVAGEGPKLGAASLSNGAATDTIIGNRTVTDSTAPTGDSGTLTNLFSWLGNIIKGITGELSWRTAASISLKSIKTILDAATNLATVSTFMKRDASGRAKVAAPSASDDIARKQEVDAVQSNLTTHTSDGVAHITASERTSWNAKETTSGAQSKADAAAAAAAAASVPLTQKGAANGVADLDTSAKMFPENLPYGGVINLLPDSGRFVGSGDNPFSISCSDTFINSQLFTGWNGTSVVGAGKFYHDTSTFGGGATALTSDVSSLLTAITTITGQANQRYGTEFHIASYTMGSGTANQNGTVPTTYLMTVNNNIPAGGLNRAYTVSFWIRLKTGTKIVINKSGRLRKNGVDQATNLQLTTTDGWVHIESVIAAGNGYSNAAPNIHATPGDNVQIALPVLVTGDAGVGIHSDPIIGPKIGDIPDSTTTARGLMSSQDKTTLNNITGYGTTAGTSTAYTVTLSPIPTGYVTGMRITVKFHVASGSNPTINVNGLGAKSIKKPNGNSPTLALNGVYTMVYDGTNFILQGEGGEYGTAAAAQVLEGYTFGTESGLVSGTMSNKLAQTQAVSIGTSVGLHALIARLPRGAYLTDAAASGYPEAFMLYPDVATAIGLTAGKIMAGNTIMEIAGTATNGATATAADIITGLTAYKNGSQLIGSMPKHVGDQTSTGGTLAEGSMRVEIPENGYYEGLADLVVTDAGIAASKILAGQSIRGLAGTATSDATAAAGDILSGKTAYKNGAKITGTIADKRNVSTNNVGITSNTSGELFLNTPDGLYNSTASIRAQDDDFSAQNIRADKNVFGLQGSLPVITSGSDPAQGVGKWPDGSLAVYPSEGYRKGGPGAGEIKVTPTQLQSAEGDLTAGNIRSGTEIFGITGSMVERQYAAGTVSPDSGTYVGNFRNGGGQYVRISVTGLGFNPNVFRVRFKANGTWSMVYMGDIWGYGLGCFTSFWGVGNYWENLLFIKDESTDLQMSSSLCRALLGQGTITEVTWEAWG